MFTDEELMIIKELIEIEMEEVKDIPNDYSKEDKISIQKYQNNLTNILNKIEKNKKA